jgi:protein-disulfide isomerase/uncharacterized membrane protein
MNKKQLFQKILNVILVSIGFGTSVYLTQHYYDIRSGFASFHSACDLNKQFSCNTVALSSTAQILGYPVSSYIASVFVFLLFCTLLNFYSKKNHYSIILLITNFVSVITGLYYLFIMAFHIKAYCTFCLFIDLINICLLVNNWFLVQSLFPNFLKVIRFKLLWGPAVLFLCVTPIPFMILMNLDSSLEVPIGQTASSIVDKILAQTPVQIYIPDQPMMIGNPKAPITIIDFSDFECPFCKLAASQIHNIFKKYPNSLKLIFKHFPFDSQCNSQLKHPIHPSACEAAKLATCMHQQGLFANTYETLFENQDLFQPDNFLNIVFPILQKAIQKPISMPLLKACIASPKTLHTIQQDIELGIALKLDQIPTFFVNGYQINGLMPFSVWEDLINRLSKN